MHLLVVGGGFGGLSLIEALSPFLQRRKLTLTLLEERPFFLMGGALPGILTGSRSPTRGQRFYERVRARAYPGFRLVPAPLLDLDPERQVVITPLGEIPYDALVLAPGAQADPERIPGLKESAFLLCEYTHMVQARALLAGLLQGTVVISITAVPYKCPPAPFEYAFLLNSLFRKKRREKGIKIILTSPEPQPIPLAGKEIGERIASLLKAEGIEFIPNASLEEVVPRTRTLRYSGGITLKYELFLAMPPYTAPRVFERLNLTDGSRFIPVEPQTFKTKLPGVYALGDGAAIPMPFGKPHPKAGVFAEQQGKTLARNLLATWFGEQPEPYPGFGECFLDLGRRGVSFLTAQLLGEGAPRFTMAEPSPRYQRKKQEFERSRLRRWFQSP